MKIYSVNSRDTATESDESLVEFEKVEKIQAWVMIGGTPYNSRDDTESNICLSGPWLLFMESFSGGDCSRSYGSERYAGRGNGPGRACIEPSLSFERVYGNSSCRPQRTFVHSGDETITKMELRDNQITITLLLILCFQEYEKC